MSVSLKFEKWVDFLIELNNENPKYLKEICDKIKITWSHGSNIAKKLIDGGFIVKEISSKNSRIKMYTLTVIGKQLQENVRKAKKTLNGED